MRGLVTSKSVWVRSVAVSCSAMLARLNRELRRLELRKANVQAFCLELRAPEWTSPNLGAMRVLYSFILRGLLSL